MNVAAWAKRYCERGLALALVPPGQKGPRMPGWQREENCITDPAQAFDLWSRKPVHGIACVLGHSGLVSLDVDDLDLARQVFGELGVDIDALRLQFPTVVGRPDRCRIMFCAPADDLQHRNLTWPEQGNPRHRRVIAELRAGAVADTLPPTIHPTTGKPYRWEGPPRNGFPALPGRLLDLWRDWPQTDSRVLAMCPWAPKPEPRPIRRPRTGDESVIERFNQAYDLDDVLLPRGYRKQGRRYLPPDCQHAAGLVRLQDRIYCHHAGDVLGDGRAHDAFGAWCLLEFGGDARQAVKAAAGLLGMQRSA
jgi:putative DNA primase/helicase